MEIRIEIRLADNGVIVEYDDPEIREKNRLDDGPWEEARRELVFKDMKTALPEVQTLLKKLAVENTSADEYDAAFDEAATND